jgi:RimJ/RimL family protein N-acetyltransferase
MEVDATGGVDAVITEIDTSFSSNRRCHGRPYRTRAVFFGRLVRWRLLNLRPPDPPLSDELVSLRPWTIDDVPAIAAACDEEVIARWIHQIPSPYEERDAREFVQATQAAWRDGNGAFFAVVEHEGIRLAGAIAIHVTSEEAATVEVGYWAAASARGRGLTTRALRLISKWALAEAGAARVQLRADVLNVASLRVAEKAGYAREGTLRAAGFNARENRRIDYAVFSLLPGEI